MLRTTLSACALFVAAGCATPAPDPGGSDAPPAGTVPAEPIAYAAPHDSLIPDGPMGVAIRRGRAILTATKDSLPDYVGNDLRCTTCHLDAGTRLHAAPWLGILAQFPQYRGRNARINTIEDRVNDCIQRSLNGKPLPETHPAMRDIVAYMGWLSRGVPMGATVVGAGFQRGDPLEADTTRGREVFVAECSRCHGLNGEGIVVNDSVIGTPLWGPRAYSIGAGMARVRTAAAFIRVNMPYDRPGSLTDQQAFDVAAYVDTRPRADFPGKEYDWPRGGEPPDVAYLTNAMRARGVTAPP